MERRISRKDSRDSLEREELILKILWELRG